jgi:hypothetical protein
MPQVRTFGPLYGAGSTARDVAVSPSLRDHAGGGVKITILQRGRIQLLGLHPAFEANISRRIVLYDATAEMESHEDGSVVLTVRAQRSAPEYNMTYSISDGKGLEHKVPDPRSETDLSTFKKG